MAGLRRARANEPGGKQPSSGLRFLLPGASDGHRPGFDLQILERNDDNSTGLLPINFPINFFGTIRQSLFINNNGNVTFDTPLASNP